MPIATFVNALRVPVEREAEFIEKWDRGAEYVRSQPGLIWTSLHRNLEPNGEFRFFTVALWESPEAFRAATSTEWWKEYRKEFGLTRDGGPFSTTPSVCEVVRSAAPFDLSE